VDGSSFSVLTDSAGGAFTGAKALEADVFPPPPLDIIAAIMSLDVGARLGAYQTTALIGLGGMGEVYRAHDTKLGRDVAIKILPRAFSTDVERLSRFEREARMLASLNHPSIAAIYGVEEADGVRALVMELVEGDTLAERLSAVAADSSRSEPARWFRTHEWPPIFWPTLNARVFEAQRNVRLDGKLPRKCSDRTPIERNA
jgi:hypothetical protein